MPGTSAVATTASSTLADEEVVRRVLSGEGALFEILMRRYNQRLYRAARSVVKDESEAEDVMQQAYINAFTHLHQFEERARFSTWMTRITLNEAFARRRKLLQSVAPGDPLRRSAAEEVPAMNTLTSAQPDPERQAYAGELHRLLEEAVDGLPEAYRTVFMLRDVEGLSTSEAGDGLGLSAEAVKTRLHRARAMIRRAVTARLGATAASAFSFPAVRCDRVVGKVLAAIGILPAA